MAWEKGMPRPFVTRAKIAATKKGHETTTETRAKISTAVRTALARKRAMLKRFAEKGDEAPRKIVIERARPTAPPPDKPVNLPANTARTLDLIRRQRGRMSDTALMRSLGVTKWTVFADLVAMAEGVRG